MYVRRIQRPGKVACEDAGLFLFEAHYVLSSHQVQQVVLEYINVPTIDGFQCPSWEQDAEQNALLKTILFTPWCCDSARNCGDIMMHRHQIARASSSGQATFKRAWRLRCSEIHVLASRAERKCHAARKWPVMADTVLFAERKVPLAPIRQGEDIKSCLAQWAFNSGASQPAQAARFILQFCGLPGKQHEE